MEINIPATRTRKIQPITNSLKNRLVSRSEDKTGTVLDDEFERVGRGRIDLCGQYLRYSVLTGAQTDGHVITGVPDHIDPDDALEDILVPFSPTVRVGENMFILDELSHVANLLLQRIHDENKDRWLVQRTIWRFYSLLESRTLGRKGLFRRHLIEPRYNLSYRAVALGTRNIPYNTVGIPLPIHQELQSYVNSGKRLLGTIDREPTLWTGSVHVVQIIPTGVSDVIMLNPLLLKPMNCDFDGDCVAVAVPRNQKKLEKAFNNPHLVEMGEWTEEFLLSGLPAEPDWSDTVADQKQRTVSYTLSPKELLGVDESPYLEQCKLTGAKKVPDTVQLYAKGISTKEFLVQSQDNSLDMIRTKREIGVLGATTDKLVQTVMAFAPANLVIALNIKEKLAQMLLDSAKSGETTFDANKIADILGQRGELAKQTIEGLVDSLAKLGIQGQLLEWLRQVLESIQTELPLGNATPAYKLTKVASADTLSEPNTGVSCVADKALQYVRRTSCTKSQIS
jgi:hypothetical protein